MTVLRALLERPEERLIRDGDLWGKWSRGADIATDYSASGVRVNRDTAMQLSAVWASVTLIADAIASFPLDTFVRREGVRRPYRPRPAWVVEPNSEQPRYSFIQQIGMSLLLHGTAYVYTGRNGTGEVAELLATDPAKTTPTRQNGRLSYEVRADDGQVLTLGPSQMFHIPARSWPGQIAGISPLEAARRMLGTGLGSQEFAERYFGQGFSSAGIVEVPEGVDVTPEQARELKEDFQRLSSGLKRAHLPAVLTQGATWKPNTVTPEQAQFLESRKFSVAEIARWFRVPPHLIGDVERSTSWGTGIEEQNIAFVQHTLRPWLELVEGYLTRHLLVSPAFVKFNVDSLLRGDIEKRNRAFATGRQWGWLSVNEIREKDDMPPVEGGDEYLTPTNMTNSPQGAGNEG